MADKNTDKEALKAQKEAEKAAKKAKEERIKQSKPKKEGTVISRGSSATKKFFKDFTGTCKKVVWPTGKQVIKNSGVVLATILVVGLAVFAVDWALTEVFDLGKELAVEAGEQFSYAEETTEEATTALNENEEGTSATTAVTNDTTDVADETTTAADDTQDSTAEDDTDTQEDSTVEQESSTAE